MSGHSKWSTIKRKKGAADAKRGKIFTKLIREITIAARIGGGDPNSNPRLRGAVLAARQQNMPGDNVDRAIKRGTGELEGVTYEEITYEAYGPGGAAMLIDVTTDNKQRTVSEIRHAIEQMNGNLAAAGAVAWNFETKGYFVVAKEKIEEDKLMELALDAGAEDIRDAGTNFEVLAPPRIFDDVKAKLEKQGIQFVSAEVTKLPKNTVKLDLHQAEQMLKLVETLEDMDDVQNVHSNSDISDEVISQLGQ